MNKLLALGLLLTTGLVGQTQFNMSQRQMRATGSTIAGLPGTPTTGELAIVTDGADASDCTTGGGSLVVFCRYNGSAWASVAGTPAPGTALDILIHATGGALGTVSDGNKKFYEAGDATRAKVFLVTGHDGAFAVSDFNAESYADGGDAFGGQFRGRAATGTEASPGAVNSTGRLVRLVGSGYDTTGFQNGGTITIQPTETWTASARGTEIAFEVTDTGSTTRFTPWVLQSNGDWDPQTDNSYDIGNNDVRVQFIYTTRTFAESFRIDDTGHTGSFRLENDGTNLEVQDTGGTNMVSMSPTVIKLEAPSLVGTDSQNVASAATVALPAGNLFHITGTTTITTVNTCDSTTNGRQVTMIFDAVLTLTDGSNLKLAGNFATTADDTLTMVCDGSNWFEVARRIN